VKRVVDSGLMVSWYGECNLSEDEDEMPKGTPISKRIVMAGNKNLKVPQAQRADLMELDAGRRKFLGELDTAWPGNDRKGFERDTENIMAASFRYLAKSPTFAEFAWLRKNYKPEFTPRIVFEDLLVDSEYMDGYKEIREKFSDVPITIICHSGAYGGAPGTSAATARAFADSLSDGEPVEVWLGLPTSAKLLRAFPESAAPEQAKTPSAPLAGAPTQRLEGNTECLTFARVTNVRSLPDIKGEIREELSYGTTFWAHAIDGDWYPVDLIGDGACDGFIHKGLVRAA
jgi:hypothetical protein